MKERKKERRRRGSGGGGKAMSSSGSARGPQQHSKGGGEEWTGRVLTTLSCDIVPWCLLVTALDIHRVHQACTSVPQP